MVDISAAFKDIIKEAGVFDKIANGCARAAEQCSNVASAMNKKSDIMKKTSSATDALSSALDKYEKSASAVVYASETTRTATEAEVMMHNHKLNVLQSCVQSGKDLTSSIESNINKQKELSATIEQAAVLSELFSNIDVISAEKKNNLAEATKSLNDVSNAMIKIQEKGAKALENLAETAEAGNINYEKLKTAQDKVATATERTITVNGKAASTADELSNSIANITGADYKKTFDSYAKATVDATKAQNELSKAGEAATIISDKLAKSNNVTAATKKSLAEASDKVKNASSELAKAQEKATTAAGNLAKVADDSSASIEELEAAQRQSAEATEALGKANTNASQSIGGLAKAIAKAGVEFVASKILEWAGKAAEALINLGNEFSNAQSVIVKATGATGTQLDGFSESMMNVYAASKSGDLSAVAGAMGEVNKRLGMQGEELEETTALFMDYSRVTGTSVSGAVQSVDGIMKSWGGTANNAGLILDMLTLAGQKSGVAVGTLSDNLTKNQEALQSLGFGLGESVALLSMLESKGIDSSAAADGMNQALSYFSENGLDASSAMRDLIDDITNAETSIGATKMAADVFGDSIGTELAEAIQSGDLKGWVADIAAADGTLTKTAEASTTLEEKWTKASNSFKSAFSSNFSPAIEGISSGLASAVNGVGDFLNKHPKLTTAITGIATGLAVASAALLAYNAAMVVKSLLLPVITAQTAFFGVTLQAAIWPITAIVAGVALLVVGLTALFKWLDSTDDEYNKLTATSKEHSDSIGQMTEKYDKMVASGKEGTEEAKKLAAEIEAEKIIFEATKMTIEEFIAENDALIDSNRELISSYNDNMKEMEKNKLTSDVFISKLSDLSNKTDEYGKKVALTTGEQADMAVIVDKLNKSYPSLALSYDKATGKLNKSVESIKALTEAESQYQRQMARKETELEALAKQEEFINKVAVAQEQVNAAQKRRDEVGGFGIMGDSKQAKKDLEQFNAEMERLLIEQSANNNFVVNIQAEINANSEEFEKIEAYKEWSAGIETAASEVKDSLSNVNEAWQSAYDAAYSSISQQIGLFGEFRDDLALSTDKLLEMWDTHSEYVDKLTQNVSEASEIFKNNDMVAELASSGEKGAAQLAQIMEEYRAILADEEKTEQDVKDFVTNLEETYNRRKEALKNNAIQSADMSPEVANALAEAEAAIDKLADKMNISDEVIAYGGEAAKQYLDSFSEYFDGNTIFEDAGDKVKGLDKKDDANMFGSSIGSQYADGISGKINAVSEAAGKLSDEVSKRLSSTTVTISASVTASEPMSST